MRPYTADSLPENIEANGSLLTLADKKTVIGDVWHSDCIGRDDPDEPTQEDAERMAAVVARRYNAVPDLLAVCRKFVADIEAVGVVHAADTETGWPDLVPTYHKAITAIAKATGEERA